MQLGVAKDFVEATRIVSIFIAELQPAIECYIAFLANVT